MSSTPCKLFFFKPKSYLKAHFDPLKDSKSICKTKKEPCLFGGNNVYFRNLRPNLKRVEYDAKRMVKEIQNLK